MKVCILGLQSINPPETVGRIRLLGLYGGFCNDMDAVCVGPYEQRGSSYREHRLTPCLTEVNVSLSAEHSAANDALCGETGIGCIDSVFPIQAPLFPELIARARKEAADAQVVVFSQPWLFASIAPTLDRARQLIVYDAQNCEGFLCSQTIAGWSDEAERVRRCAVRREWELCHAAHLVLACSREDREQFLRYYGLSPQRVAIVPNGVFSTAFRTDENASTREALRRRMGIDQRAVCFVASDDPHSEAAANLVLGLAERLPQYLFVIVGGIGKGPVERELPGNLTVTGLVSGGEKREILMACDLAVNPMLSGTGNSTRMLDYMAAGLPTVTTAKGARGIPNTDGCVYELCEGSLEAFYEGIQSLLTDDRRREELREYSRQEAHEKYCWDRISLELGYMLNQRYRREILGEKPFFSVVIPSYERPELLRRLLENLKRQQFTDFEIIIVDQSRQRHANMEKHYDLDILYYWTDIKGAVKARNTGIRLARGEVVAFIDDDCVPDADWLLNAWRLMRHGENIGVEGLVYADSYDESQYRVVSNVNAQGMGYITANLFVRWEVLRRIDGFDESFDNPHFREDTDLGWRAREFGPIPFADDVRVLHPSHRRGRGRESREERNRFFVHDPLLLKKHDADFLELFLSEEHYHRKDYWDYFRQGMKRHHVDPALLDIIASDERVLKEYLPEDLFAPCCGISNALAEAKGGTGA